MDEQRFDALTRLVGRGLTRRQFAAALGAALAGALGRGVTGQAVSCRATGRSCREHANCCSGLCGLSATGRRVCQCQTIADCPAPPRCHQATCLQGLCGTAPTSGGPCDDGDACTRNDVCQNGVCVGGDPVVCTALDQCHDAGVCDPRSGKCSNPDKPDGTSCNDDNACTEDDSCQDGVCVGKAVVCTTSNPCLTAGCDPASGCFTTPKATGTACPVSDRCDGDETCDGAGNCVAGTPVNCGPCLRCNPSNGTCEVDQGKIGQVCTPTTANRCFGSHSCDAGGTCVGQNPVVCTAQDQCHDVGTCDPTTGVCSNPNKADGTECNDGNACTQSDTCQDGVCTGGNPVICSDPPDPQCQRNACQPATGQCVSEAINEGQVCDDGDLCTSNTVCTNGQCLGNQIICVANECDASVACNGSGCLRTFKANGTPCSSGACCNGTCCTSGQSCCGGGGSEGGCCDGPCCGGTVCCAFANGVCCPDGQCYVGVPCDG